MAGLTVGKVGLVVELGHPADWRDSSGQDGWDTTISGYMRASSMADTQALRKELLAQNGRLVAVTYSLDDTLDGFYVQTSARVETIPVSFRGVGLFPFEVGLRRFGGASDVQFQSLITPVTLTNDHGLVDAEVTPFHAPPLSIPLVDATYEASGTFTKVTRTGSDGAQYVYVFTGHPTSDINWSCDPDELYAGGCSLTVDGYVRAGLQVPNTPGSWEMTNGLVKVTPGGGGTNNGRINVAHYDGSQWDAALGWEWERSGSRINTWRYVSCLRNDPEAVGLRFKITSLVSVAGWTLDLYLRRGSRFLTGLLSFTGTPGNLTVQKEAIVAGTTVTPAGASSGVAVRATANDASGNRYVVGSAGTIDTYDTTQGGVTKNSAQILDFFIGSEIGGSGAAATDTAESLCLQYVGWLSETVRATRR